ncbi:hypothetical protein [Halobacillus sp. Nhm2S1]|uniref:hypothetical protein n=1 Tax=Halobacillus sp. Nhm2S1 TaxID=2866716 RepID=UPI001C734930|nr:hypothetical protein [Halobacillus sp. Nhm2S1]MBX0358491.1 hypothetical protein [Halobacillus sp. Nhm2S1]
MSDLKLTIEIRKPSYAQHRTVRGSIPRTLWNRVRDHVLKENNDQCQICGRQDEKKLHAHEVWDYDEDKFLLILKEIQPLCRSCHDLKHIHHVGHRGNGNKTSNDVMRNLKKHFMKVNGCTEKDFVRHYRNQLAKSSLEPEKRSMEDLIELRNLREREEFLNEQDWKFVIGKGIPFTYEIEAQLLRKGLLYVGEEHASSLSVEK